MLSLGILMIEGAGVDANLKKGLGLIEKAANAGNAEAQNTLAVCYRNGIGADANYAFAFYWYGKATEQGLAVAQNNLADCYFHGVGISEDKGRGRQMVQAARPRRATSMRRATLAIAIWTASEPRDPQRTP